MTHHWQIRVYYEDTDLAGIVYYANYFKFIERARSEYIRELGIDQRQLKAAGMVFAVRRVEADFLSPARFDDLLDVETGLARLGGASVNLEQTVSCGATRLFQARIRLAVLSESGRPLPIPADIRQKFQIHAS